MITKCGRNIREIAGRKSNLYEKWRGIFVGKSGQEEEEDEERKAEVDGQHQGCLERKWTLGPVPDRVICF